MDNAQLDKLAAIADRVDARGLFNASADMREWIAQASAQQESAAPAGDDFAVRFIEQRAEQYLQDHADTEPDTGAFVFEYGEAGREYHSTLIELADDIRAALAQQSSQPPVPVVAASATGKADAANAGDVLDGLRGVMCAVGIVGKIDGHDVIRRSSVLDLIDRSRASATSAADAKDAALRFADHIINGMFEGGDWGGGDVQELAVKYGLLVQQTMDEPCGEDGTCQCAGNVPFFPAICYRKTYVSDLRAAIAATQAQSSAKGGDAVGGAQ